MQSESPFLSHNHCNHDHKEILPSESQLLAQNNNINECCNKETLPSDMQLSEHNVNSKGCCNKKILPSESLLRSHHRNTEGCCTMEILQSDSLLQSHDHKTKGCCNKDILPSDSTESSLSSQDHNAKGCCNKEILPSESLLSSHDHNNKGCCHKEILPSESLLPSHDHNTKGCCHKEILPSESLLLSHDHNAKGCCHKEILPSDSLLQSHDHNTKGCCHKEIIPSDSLLPSHDHNTKGCCHKEILPSHSLLQSHDHNTKGCCHKEILPSESLPQSHDHNTKGCCHKEILPSDSLLPSHDHNAKGYCHKEILPSDSLLSSHDHNTKEYCHKEILPSDSLLPSHDHNTKGCCHKEILPSDSLLQSHDHNAKGCCHKDILPSDSLLQSHDHNAKGYCHKEILPFDSLLQSHDHNTKGCCHKEILPSDPLLQSHDHNNNGCCDSDIGCCDFSSDVFEYAECSHAYDNCCGTLHTSHPTSTSCCRGDSVIEEMKTTADSTHYGTTSNTGDACITVVAEVCNSCDPCSDIPHAIQVTRIRIANLCCAGEERIIRTTLAGMTGVDHVAVNIIGRYAIVKHCPVACCSPSSLIVEKLNTKHLGASLQEAGGKEEPLDESLHLNYVSLCHAALITVLFLIAVLVEHASSDKPYGVSLGIYIVTVGIGIVPIVKAASISLQRYTLDIHILMLVAIAGAVATEEYLDAALVVVLFILAELIEENVMNWVRRAVRRSAGAIPNMVNLADGKSILADDTKIGDVVVVRAGDMILVDGEVSRGQGVVDESALTGEAVPVNKSAGSKAISGTVVQNGYFEIRVTCSPEDSTLRRLRQMVEDVQTDRGQFARVVDRVSLYWTPAVLLAALLVVLIAGATSGDWLSWTQRSLVLLVLACPCSIVVAAPIPAVCAIVTASKNGVLIKGSSIIERVGLLTVLAVDKTGTLTKGFFSVLKRLRLHGEEEEAASNRHSGGMAMEVTGGMSYDPLQLAAAIEDKCTHPLGAAIVSAYCGCIADMEGELPPVKGIKVIEGVGVEGWVEHTPPASPSAATAATAWLHVRIGNERMIGGAARELVPLSTYQQSQLTAFTATYTGCTIVLIAVENKLEMMLALSDEVRDDAAEAVKLCMAKGLSVSMLTGDHQSVALQVCQSVGIPADQCHSRLLPEDKLAWVKAQQTERGEVVMMVGDGINDAASLAVADVGVAMGEGGTAMASQAAGIVLMSTNLCKLPNTIGLCRYARSVIIQNCFLSIIVKLVAVVLAITGYLTLWAAVLVDVGTLLVVLLNGTLLLLSRAYQGNDSNLPPPTVTGVSNF